MTDSLTKIASKSLGDSTSYAVYTEQFDPSLLNPMPRSVARDLHGITGTEFKGHDVWTCHESTFLLDNGLPIAGTLKFLYSSESELMIESKSMKLYLNSFDMCRMGDTVNKAVVAYEEQITNDLKKALKTDVRVKFFTADDYANAGRVDLLKGSKDLMATYTQDFGFDNWSYKAFLEKMVIDDYSGERNHIEAVETGTVQQHSYYTNILRSRCRHTKQKDTGTALINYRSSKLISPPSILKQIISLREVNEFHEFCAEKLFVEIYKHLNPGDALTVTLLYSRRGSLDINPTRTIGYGVGWEYGHFLDPGMIVTKTQGQ